MNVLKFKKPKPDPVPRVKSKPVPRLRLIRNQKDIRLSKSEFQVALNAWMKTLDGFIETCDDYKSVWVAITLVERCMPVLAWRVDRHSGNIHSVSELQASKSPVGNILESVNPSTHFVPTSVPNFVGMYPESPGKHGVESDDSGSSQKPENQGFMR